MKKQKTEEAIAELVALAMQKIEEKYGVMIELSYIMPDPSVPGHCGEIFIDDDELDIYGVMDGTVTTHLGLTMSKINDVFYDCANKSGFSDGDFEYFDELINSITF